MISAGLHELPLVGFTVLAQGAVGAWLFGLLGKRSENGNFLLKAGLGCLFILGLAFACSILHLGSPWRAFNALNRVGQSMLSNEIASGAVCFALMAVSVLLQFKSSLSDKADQLLRWGVGLSGVLFIAMMAEVYRLPTVSSWQSSLTLWQFWLTVIVLGCCVVACWRIYQQQSLGNLPLCYGIGVMLIAIVAVYQGVQWTTLGMSADFAPITAVRLILLGVSLGIMCYRPQRHWLILVAGLTLISELLGRTLFYGAYLSAGV